MTNDNLSNTSLSVLPRTVNTVLARSALLGLVCVLVIGLPGVVLLSAEPVVAQDKLSKSVLIELSREQSKVLCSSEVFTSCMGFEQNSCIELSEKAVQQCLMPLPDTIDLASLDNDAIEACPREVYEEAGYSEEKAQVCLQKALEK